MPSLTSGMASSDMSFVPIDRWRDTAPWGLIIGLVLGVVIGFYDLVKTTWRR